MSTFVGISGWTYPGWRGTFYPKKLPQQQELYFASHTLPSIEINGTFYSLQRPESYSRWYETTPDNFVFSVKANRYITHVKKLNDVEVPIANFFASGILNLKEKLARKNVLKKERTSLTVETNYLLRHAVEIRHFSFLNPWFTELLRAHNVALVFADTAGKWPYMEDVTSDFLYLRLHGDSELYVSGYDEQALEFWKDRIEKWTRGEEPKDRLTIDEARGQKQTRDAFVYFDNDAKIRAPVDAKSLIEKLHLPHNY